MKKSKRKRTAAEKAARKQRREEYMTIFIGGKQKRIQRPPPVEGMDVDEFILQNADPTWLHQNGMWEVLHEREMLKRRSVDMTYDTIEEAFLFVSGAALFERTAVVHRQTGETFYASLMSDYDELPEDLDESDDYVGIPHKNDLDLGKPLVMDFVRSQCPKEVDRILTIFRRRGAYGRFKDFLKQKGLLDDWYVFEQQRTRQALLQWCEENDIELE